MKKIIIIFFFIAFQISFCKAQMTFKIDRNIPFPDFSVNISENVSFPDITVKIGEDVSFEDFTIGITHNKNQADFIITKSMNPDFKVMASENISFPDIRVKAGEDVSFPDITIEIKDPVGVDYLIFSEKPYISLNEIVIVLLPVINKELDNKFEKIPAYIGKSSGIDQNSIISNYNYTYDVNSLKDSKIFAQDDKKSYLGKIADEYDPESIFNEYGTYGSEHSASSIWNEYSTFGNEYNSLSPFNDYCSKPPVIEKNGEIIGYITTNKSLSIGISPYLLKELKDKF